MTAPGPLIVGRLPFLVCAPFFHSTLRGAEGIRFVDGVPSFLNGALQARRADCAPSSSFEYGLHFRDYRLFPGISTSSTMEMKSVLFLSQVPWEDLDGVPVALSSDSATSNVLFRILCGRRFAVKPRLLPAAEEAAPGEAVGRVFIGDRALQESLSGKWKHRYDLADVWARWQDLPFSFGLWMVRREALAEKPALVSRFHALLLESLAAFRADAGKALDAWTAVYPSPLPRSLMLGFYETADYGFTERHARSLERFYRLAGEEGFLDAVPSLDFAAI
ncbi:MAG TPA: menaquinone biosynthesis protein [Fibrobacteria bacterium]|nr:menaquinone biosynthesis protein [Fibrobacteria bacterium]